jgi:hypothetical protein
MSDTSLPLPAFVAANWTDMSVQEWLRGYALAGVPAGLVLGLLLGLVARRDDGWGGYASFPRRAARLGHIAAVMLPALAGLYAVLLSGPGGLPVAATGAAGVEGAARSSAAFAAAPPGAYAVWGAALWIAGGLTLPTALYAAAWRRSLAPLLSVPALAVVAGAVCLAAAGLQGGRP